MYEDENEKHGECMSNGHEVNIRRPENSKYQNLAVTVIVGPKCNYLGWQSARRALLSEQDESDVEKKKNDTSIFYLDLYSSLCQCQLSLDQPWGGC